MPLPLPAEPSACGDNSTGLLSWGWQYGLVSLLLGLGGQTMWFLWVPINGWAPFVSSPLYNLWILWHGWCAHRKRSGFLAHFRDYGFCGAMVKPYQLHELSAAINQAFI